MDELIENAEQIDNSDHSYSMLNAVDTVETILQNAYSECKDTTSEALAHNALDTILSKRNNLSSWYTKQCSTIENIYENCCSVQARKLKQKHLTDFHANFQQYMVSVDNLQSIKFVTQVEFSQHFFSSEKAIITLLTSKTLFDKLAL